jgi:biotin transport system substrate-specific component
MSILERTKQEAAAQDIVEDARARKLVGGIMFVLLTSLGAYVAIWFLNITPIPITLQPLFVILSGAVLGPVAGALSMASYVLLGAAGAPVFAGGRAGYIWLFGPTGGYLLAYPAAAFVVGLLAGRSAGGLRLLGALTIGMALIYLGGLSQLWLLTRQDLGTVVMQSVIPFLPGDLLKIALAWLTVRSIRSTSFGRLF